MSDSALIQDLVEKLSGLTLQQAAELSKTLEDTWGISPVVAAAAPAAAADAPAAAEKTEFNVVLKAVGAEKIKVIKVVREATGLGLKEAKELTENLGTIKEGADKEVAEKIKTSLEEVGATVELS